MSLKSLFFQKKQVLIVEDDIRLRSSLKDRFTMEGYAVFEAGDAKEVLALVANENIHALVLDLILPLKDGISLLGELRANGHTMPVVILSNLLGSDSLRDDAKRLDAVYYNKSNTSLDEIVQAVSSRI